MNFILGLLPSSNYGLQPGGHDIRNDKVFTTALSKKKKWRKKYCFFREENYFIFSNMYVCSLTWNLLFVVGALKTFRFLTFFAI